MPLKCEIHLTDSPSSRVVAFKFWNAQADHSAQESCDAVQKLDYGERDDGTVLLSNTVALRTLVAFLLRAKANGDLLAFRLTEADGSEAKTLAAAFSKTSLGNGKPPWPQLLFGPLCPSNPVLQLRSLFDFSCGWKSRRFSFALRSCWKDAIILVKGNGWQLDQEEFLKWADKLERPPQRSKAMARMDRGRPQEPDAIPPSFGQFMHELAQAPVGVAKRAALMPTPRQQEMADFSPSELERRARQLAGAAKDCHEGGKYHAATKLNSLAAKLSEFSGNLELAGWCLVCALSSLRPLGASAQIRETFLRLHGLLLAKPRLGECFGAPLFNELGALGVNHDERECAEALCNASDRCSRQNFSRFGAVQGGLLPNLRLYTACRLGQAAGKTNFGKGLEQLRDARKQFRTERDAHGEVTATFCLVELFNWHSRPEQGLELLEEIEPSLAFGSRWITAMAPGAKGVLLLGCGREAEAEGLLRRSLLEMNQLGIRPTNTPPTPLPLDAPDLALLALRPNDGFVGRTGRLQARGAMPLSPVELRMVTDLVMGR